MDIGDAGGVGESEPLCFGDIRLDRMGTTAGNVEMNGVQPSTCVGIINRPSQRAGAAVIGVGHDINGSSCSSRHDNDHRGKYSRCPSHLLLLNWRKARRMTDPQQAHST